jgi:hypothetical protein
MNNSAAKFQSLAARIKDADDKVDVIEGAGTVSAKVLTEMKSIKNAFGEAGAKLLAELADAEDSTGKDPLVRYKWIERQLALLSQQQFHDPETVLRMVSLCRASMMPDKKTPARPFIIGFSSLEEAQQYANENVGKGVHPLAMPIVSYRGDGAEERLMMHNVKHYVPNGPAERAAFVQIVNILKKTETSILAILHNEYLFDLRKAVDWIVRIIPGAVLVHKGRLFDNKAYARKGKDVYQPVPRGPFLCAFSLTREENLLVPNTPANREMVERLKIIKGQNEWLKKVDPVEDVGIEISMLSELRAGEVPVVTPQEFLKGHPGQVAIYRDWTAGAKKGLVFLHFMRRDDGAWRVMLYNEMAAVMLLTSKEGVERRFTWFTGHKIPGHLENLLMTGNILSTAEDIGLTEERIAEIAANQAKQPDEAEAPEEPQEEQSSS